MKKIIDLASSYVRYLMCVFAFLSILGVLIPATVWGIPIGNYFALGKNAGIKMNGGAVRAVIIILVAIFLMVVAVKAKSFTGSAICLVCAVVIVIVAGVAGMGSAAKFIGGGIKLIRWARIWLLITSIINSAVFALKEFVIKE